MEVVSKSISGSFRDLKCLLAETDCQALDNEESMPFQVRQRAHKLCSSFLGGQWKCIETVDMIMRRIKGGMTNMLFLCRLPDAAIGLRSTEPAQVLIRVYFNPETEDHLVAESVIFTLLSERHLGPKLFGIFNGGRLEEYIPSRPLSTAEQRSHALSMKIAQRMARIHQLQVPINKDPDYVIEALQRWLDQLNVLWTEQGAMSTPTDNACEHINLHKQLMQEFEIVKAFDFANHFCEWMIDYDVEAAPKFHVDQSVYPSAEQQTDFFRSYLAAQSISDSPAAQLEAMLKETKQFVAVSHFFWGVWAKLQVEVSPVEFGFKEYADKRLELYHLTKKDMLTLRNNAPVTFAAKSV